MRKTSSIDLPANALDPMVPGLARAVSRTTGTYTERAGLVRRDTLAKQRPGEDGLAGGITRGTTHSQTHFKSLQEKKFADVSQIGCA
jgi:hypothetical protein